MHRYRLSTYRERKAHRQWNTTCPDCGRHGEFVPYIDAVTMRPIDDRCCGRCNRESNCGYHLSPAQWWADHRPIDDPTLTHEQRAELYAQRRREEAEARRLWEERQAQQPPPFDPTATEQPPYVVDYLACTHMQCLLSQSTQSDLACWLRTRYASEAVDTTLRRYRIGATAAGATIYWQIDERDRVRAGKVMRYDTATGHRIKGTATPAVTWVNRMAEYGRCERPVPQCLFGLHRLGEAQGRPIAIVESEKTALMLDIAHPQALWMATGGKQNFKEELLWPLCGHEVYILPDADALDSWSQRIMTLRDTLPIDMHIPAQYYQLMDNDEARTKGWDLGDVLNYEL